MRPVIRHIALAQLLLLSTAMAPVHGQNWPARPVRIISPFAPGGGNDTLSRLIAESLSTPARLGQQVIVENRPGANTIVGTELVVKSPPDGHTLIVLPNAITINPHLYRKLPFDVTRDLAPITQIGTSPMILVVHPSFPARTTRELLAIARARPNDITNGSSGNGSLGHLIGALMDITAGTKLVHVPYKGTALAVTDLLGGQIVLSFASAITVMPQVKAGRLRAIAVTGPRRSPALPDIPAIAETVPGFSAELWYAMFAPAGTPGDIINRLNRELREVLSQPDLREKLSAQGVETQTSTPEEMARLIAADIRKWEKVVRTTGTRID